MRAIQVSEHGGPEVLTYTELPEPSIGAGGLLVETEAIGINFIDTYIRTGTYPQDVPYVPGAEGTGVVTAVGDGVTEFAVGDRVAWAAAPGSYAEKAAVPADVAIPVPDGVSAPIAASVLLQGMTAHYLIESVYRPEPGETVLVHAGAGGVGLILTQLAVARGVRVITTVSSDEKEALSREAGAAEVLRYGDDLAERVRALTDGVGVAAVYDGVGKDTFDASLAALRIRGTLALFGAASGPVPPVDPQRLNSGGSLFLTRPTLAHYTRDRAELLWRAGDVFRAVADGTLRIRVGAQYPLAEAERAHRDLEGRKTTGSIVLIP
ncbi:MULTISPECIES: quinone oxidoreductase family protein [Nocardia]|uniref:quinone oxidoreductase family protein n=1 Tax=Nocardia TaxID=1817 RepID=UPI000BEF3C7E|nr:MULTISPECIES: quinone oxidoreductase [Nocardia]MBF6185848.1 quinone oxidoreductase [Nocardia farcinica]MBF6311693.1 quinone oxidoreductase [Nocardia farcinica]MBF6408677.1 quinone oxidoreductase [Nocardia farcinica]PEH76592.1 NADPH:quinone reductase [Nocardia sp. FDAARGOS_372]UEX20972.1 quinone oxidoreductase [Nocardia farcinica]